MPHAVAEETKSTQKRRERWLQRWEKLKAERSSWVAHWQEITTHLLPRNGRFFTQDRNRGTRRHNHIYDNTGSRALRVMAAGMMAGATSPARPWFRLAAADPGLNSFHPVRLWLEDVAARMQRVFQKSNTYRMLHQLYEELGAFGTAASIMLPDFDTLVHHYPVTVGEFAITADYQGRVNTFFRECEKTVAELVKEFGFEQCSDHVQQQHRQGNLDVGVTMVHVIEPRVDRDPSQADSANMPWVSAYFEVSGEPDTLLRESGYETFPVLVPRWAVAGGDVYGHSPGMEALGDVKQLQHEQVRKSEAIDYQTKPPLQAPSAMKDRDVQRLPGGVTFVDSVNPQGGVRTAFEVKLDLSALLLDIQDVRERVRSSFYADLFLMLATAGPQTRMTATEVAERHEEKLLMLGPVLERLHNELLEPLIDRTFKQMLEVGALPPPPPDLLGMDLTVEFVSMLAQAQRAIGTNAVDRFVGNLGAIAQLKPDVLDKFNADEWVDSYSDMLGVDPNIIVPEDRVEALREARNRALAAKEQAAMMEQQAATVKDLAAAPTGNTQQTALTDIMSMFSGYDSPSPRMV